MAACWKKCHEVARGNLTHADECVAADCERQARQADADVSRGSGLEYQNLQLPVFLR